MINNKRFYARLTGYALIIMALSAGFALGYAFPELYNPTQLHLTHVSIAQNLLLYRLMIIGFTIVLLLDIFVSVTLYQFFKNDNKRAAFLSGIFRIIYSLIFGIAIFYLTKNICEHNNTTIIENYNLFQTIWSIGLIVFGIHLLIVGVLMKLHKLIPKILWYLTIFAGISYILIHLLKTVFPQQTELISSLNSILGIPMALAELCLAVWLITKGGKEANHK